MKGSRLLKTHLVARHSNTIGFFCNVAWGLLTAICLSFPSSPLLLASQSKKIFNFELDGHADPQFLHCDLKIGLGRALGLPSLSGPDARRVPSGSKFCEVDFDQDGDLDLIDFSKAPRILVWVNDGRGRYFPMQ